MRFLKFNILTVCFFIVNSVYAQTAKNADWPTYLHGIDRNPYADVNIKLPLKQHWVFESTVAPRRAWPGPAHANIASKRDLPRMNFDDVFYTVVSGDTAYFGSSVDNQIHAINIATGAEKWSFFTRSPIRFAPSIQGDKLFSGSDDGFVYCLDKKSGKLLWKVIGGPEEKRILGNNNRMVGYWPVRSGILLSGDKGYFTSGIFSTEGVYVKSINLKNGKTDWTFDGKKKRGRGRDFSPQGYLAASEKHLFIPSGRRTPLCLDLSSGVFQYDTVKVSKHPRKLNRAVGHYLAVHDGNLYAGTQNKLSAINENSGKLDKDIQPAMKIAFSKDATYTLAPDGVRRINGNGKAKWTTKIDGLFGLAVSENAVFAGGENLVFALKPENGKEIWKAKVDGNAYGITISGSAVIVSTDKGKVYCFLARGAKKGVKARKKPLNKQFKVAASCKGVAKVILKKMPTLKGRCLLIGTAASSMAKEIADNSEMVIDCYVPNEKRAEALRKKINALGLYGSRISVDSGKLNKNFYPRYFANLIIVASGKGDPAGLAKNPDLLRWCRPSGGVIFARQNSKGASALAATVSKSGKVRKGLKLKASRGFWTFFKRDSLSGEGRWTHQYADVGNTACSSDTLVNGPLEVLWFGGPGPDKAIDRHAQAPAPLSINGLVFYQGEEGLPYTAESVMHKKTRRMDRKTKQPTLIECFDAYNGTVYWERKIIGVYRLRMRVDSGNMACSEDGLFLTKEAECLKLDLYTGETIKTYKAPKGKAKGKRLWGYIAVDDGRLFGSLSIDNAMTMKPDQLAQYSDTLFALDAKTGKKLWVYNGKNIRKNSISIGDGRIYFTDAGELSKAQLNGLNEQKYDFGVYYKRKDDIKKHKPVKNVQTVIALDVKKGKVVWKKEVDLTACGGSGMFGYFKDGIVLFGGGYDEHQEYLMKKKLISHRRMVALSAKNGSLLWNEKTGHMRRPLIVGDNVIAQPFGFDLKTGKLKKHPAKGGKPWKYPHRYGGCGISSASSATAFYRNHCLAFLDLNNLELTSFESIRPACWINTIPVGGVLVETEGTSGCICFYSLQSSIVMIPKEK